MWKPKYFRDDEEQAVEDDLRVGQPFLDKPPAPTASSPWSSSPSGRRIWRQTTPVATSESTYSAKNSVQRTPVPQLLVEQDGEAERDRDLDRDGQHDDDVVPEGAAEDRIAERPAEVVETDEVVERLEPVPVVEAVPGALDDR